jgi:hypothetical protein
MSTTNATDEQILEVVCYNTANSWNPDPTDFIESCSSVTTTAASTALPGTEQVIAFLVRILICIYIYTRNQLQNNVVF